jgi:hypothetical protein
VSLKPRARSVAKARDDYAQRVPGPPFSYLMDVCRAAVVCQDEEAILQVPHGRWYT